MKIKVCIPFYIEFEATKIGLHQLMECKEHDFIINPGQGALIATLRNKLINNDTSKKIHQSYFDFDYCLFIDSDISFEYSDVYKLIQEDKQIISGIYQTQKDVSKAECGLFHPGKPGKVLNRYDYNLSTGTMKVDFCGAGFMLVKKEVFQKMEYPWFRHFICKDGDRQIEIGEDYGFCVGAKKAGFKIWAHFGVKVGHRIKKIEDFNWNIYNIK